jgi:hypothetical protein
LRLAAMTRPYPSWIVRPDPTTACCEVNEMEPTLMPEIDLDPRTDEELQVHDWRAEQLREVGVPGSLADRFADHVDWRAVAALVQRGCPAVLALDIAL